jgi:hypothetical protein
MHDVVPQFAMRLVCGMSLMLCVMPRRQVATAYFRIMLLVTMGLSVLFVLTEPARFWPGVIMAAAAFVGSVLWLLERRPAGTAVIGLVALLSLFEMLRLAAPDGPSAVTAQYLLSGASALASASTLGAALTGMLLGHRYLTAPGMPLAPLIRLNQSLGMSAIFRMAVSLMALLAGAGALHESVYWIWLALRWLAGVLGPMAACVMVHRILRYRNTQAATGVLFVAVILTFIGELTADLLHRAVHAPF